MLIWLAWQHGDWQGNCSQVTKRADGGWLQAMGVRFKVSRELGNAGISLRAIGLGRVYKVIIQGGRECIIGTT